MRSCTSQSRVLIAIALYVSAGLGIAQAAPGDVYNLGTLGGTESVGLGINNVGQVVGYSLTQNEIHAFRYSGVPGAGGAMFDLGTLGGGYGHASDINDASQIAGSSFAIPGTGIQPFRYTGNPGAGGTMTSLAINGFGVAINNAGQVAGTNHLPLPQEFSDPLLFISRAFRHTGEPGAGGELTNLGTLGGENSSGFGINDAGQVVGTSEVAVGSTATHAFLWTGVPGAGGAMVDLGTLGGANSYTRDINNAGQVAGSSATTGDANFHALRYSGTPGAGGVMVDLGTLGGPNSFGYAIDDAGYVVGNATRFAQDEGVATLWQINPTNTAVDLDAWLDSANPAVGANWTLIYANDINSHGLITGSGHYDDGPGGLDDGPRAFILDASSLVVPEPASVALLGVGVIGVASRRRVRRSVVIGEK